MSCYGYIETIGLVTAIECADTAMKTANVEIVSKENPGAGMICIVIKGDIGDVRAAVEAAKESGNRIGKVISTNVIAKPDKKVTEL